MSITITCDNCNKPMDLRTFNESQTTIGCSYSFNRLNGQTFQLSQLDVCPHCAIALLTQLVTTWGG